MIDHISLPVADFSKSRAFYIAALAPLGHEVVKEFEGKACGMGIAGKPEFWLVGGEPPGTRLHIAFRAENRALVDAFHAAALAAGGKDHGAPGLRPHYHPDYYGAFVIDPDGHNIEVVCHAPE